MLGRNKPEIVKEEIKIIGTVAGIALGIAAARWATGKMKNYLGLDQTPSNYQEF